MQIGDNLHDMLEPIFKKQNKISLIANTRSVCIAVEWLMTYLGTQISYNVSQQTSFYHFAILNLASR